MRGLGTFLIICVAICITLIFGVLLHASFIEEEQKPKIAFLNESNIYLTEKVQEERERYEEERQNRIYWKSQYFACVHEQTDKRTIVELIE